MRRVANFASLSFLLFACSSTDGDDALTDDAIDQELRTSGVSGFSVERSAGLAPPPPGGCLASARYAVSFTTGTLYIKGCIGGSERQIDRALTPVEVATARKALAKVRTARRPTACPTDVPVMSLDVSRGTTELHYVQRRSACGGGIPVTDASIGALLSAMEMLSTSPYADAGAPACVEGASCLQQGASCGPQCGDPCQFCNRLVCDGGTWKHIEVMPVGQCTSPP